MFDFLKPIINILPEVKAPEKLSPLKEKLMWTGAALIIFFVLGRIFPWGINAANLSQRGLGRLEMLLGSKTGSLITAGIGPIVLASIFLQLAVGSKLIEFDLSSPEGKKLFQGLQKLLAIFLCFFEGIIYVLSGFVPAVPSSSLFGIISITQLALILQLALGSIILLYLDEVVQKYGIGSGISLFIAAGVSQSVIMGALNFLAQSGTSIPTGLIPQFVYYLFNGNIVTSFWTIIPLVFTGVVFLIVVYAEGMKIELPLSYGRIRGLGARYPLKFLYVSNIPVILAVAFLLNIQLFGMFLSNAGFTFIGQYRGSTPYSGLTYLLTSPPSPLLVTGGYPAYLSFIFQPTEILHLLVYGLALIVLSVLFGWFWIESANMGPKAVASQLESAGLQIPGFRRDPRVIEKLLEKYIPTITILGSAFVGLLAWFADITGALGTGMGILLTVGILYRFYEDLAREQIFEIYPVLKKMVA